MLEVLFKFLWPKGCHEVEDCQWRIIFVIVNCPCHSERLVEVQGLKTVSGILPTLG